MGVGKTKIGRNFAQAEGLSFLDLDEAIEEKFSSSISEIFKNKGEQEFRKIEKRQLKRSLGQFDVMALGGGTLLDSDSLKLVKSHAHLIYLFLPLNLLAEELENRPLLNAEDKETLFKHRQPAYLESHLTLDLEQLDEKQIHAKLRAFLER